MRFALNFSDLLPYWDVLVAGVIFAIYQVEIRRWLAADDLNIRSGLASLRRQLRLFINGLSPRTRL